MNNSENKNKGIICIAIILLLLLLAIGALWLTGRWEELHSSEYDILDHEAFGTYGDFVGGVIGTVFAAIAVYYAVKTYIKDKEKTETERKDKSACEQKEKIKNHFYTMLAKHNEYSYYLIENQEDCFSKYISLLENIYTSCKQHLANDDVFNLSYFYFFYGSNLDQNSIPDKHDSLKKMNEYFLINNIKFEGASKKLATYFRQIYQIVTYINDKELLTYKEKYDYIKSLRATLSNEEQYLLFVNSLSTLGEVWESVPNDKNNKLITKYNLIKNIPLNFPRVISNNDFESEYSKIHYEYEEHNEQKKRQREQRERDYK